MLHETEYFAPENEKATIDPISRAPDVFNPLHDAGFVRLDQMETGLGFYAYEAGYLLRPLEILNQVRQRHVREPVSVVGQEDFLSGQMLLDRFQTHADVRGKPCVHERNSPILDILAERVQVLTALRKHKIIGQALVVV